MHNIVTIRYVCVQHRAPSYTPPSHTEISTHTYTHTHTHTHTHTYTHAHMHAHTHTRTHAHTCTHTHTHAHARTHNCLQHTCGSAAAARGRIESSAHCWWASSILRTTRAARSLTLGVPLTTSPHMSRTSPSVGRAERGWGCARRYVCVNDSRCADWTLE